MGYYRVRKNWNNGKWDSSQICAYTDKQKAIQECTEERVQQGYKELNPHIGIIYGDGCTLSNVETIWRELEKRGFAANNIAYGVGAFCFTAIMENGKMIVATRDTFGIAMKATYGVIDGKKLMIFKDPKTDTSHLKKSHKGCCKVYYEDGELKCQDQLLEMSDDSLLTTVFKNGELIREDSFMDIRNRMYGGK